MQVFDLPGHLIRSARSASRLLAAKTPDIEAERRRGAMARWRAARAAGLTAEPAAQDANPGHGCHLSKWAGRTTKPKHGNARMCVADVICPYAHHPRTAGISGALNAIQSPVGLQAV
jgi:hypothetical protein